MKIFRPDQSLLFGKTSPEDCTFNQEFTIKSGDSILNFMGWGNSNGKAYMPGTYRIEIWLDGVKLYSTAIDIKSATQNSNKSASGIVVTTDGEAVIGASVMVRGTELGIATDINGRFTINNIPSSATTLRISYIGMEPKDVPINENVRVVMKKDR